MWKCMWGRRETRGKAGSFIWMMKCAGCETYFNKKDHLWILYEYETGQFKLLDNTKDGMNYGGCNCGNCHITIASNGDIMACRRVMDSRVANIFEDRLADVWVCQMEKYREYDKFTKCRKCELKAWCRGCPAVADGTCGSFYGADPQCWKTKNKITGEELKILEAGNFAPNAGGGQRSMMVAVHNKELAAHIGKMNMAHFDRTRLAGSYVSKEQPMHFV